MSFEYVPLFTKFKAVNKMQRLAPQRAAVDVGGYTELVLMDKHEAGEVNMDTKALDGREAVVEMVREARVDAAEDRFFTNRANMDMADRVISDRGTGI